VAQCVVSLTNILSDSRSCFIFFKLVSSRIFVVCSSKPRRFQSDTSAPCSFKWAHPSELSAADVRHNENR
jgi:hypothetical protein